MVDPTKIRGEGTPPPDDAKKKKEIDPESFKKLMKEELKAGAEEKRDSKQRYESEIELQAQQTQEPPRVYDDSGQRTTSTPSLNLPDSDSSYRTYSSSDTGGGMEIQETAPAPPSPPPFFERPQPVYYESYEERAEPIEFEPRSASTVQPPDRTREADRAQPAERKEKAKEAEPVQKGKKGAPVGKKPLVQMEAPAPKLEKEEKPIEFKTPTEKPVVIKKKEEKPEETELPEGAWETTKNVQKDVTPTEKEAKEEKEKKIVGPAEVTAGELMSGGLPTPQPQIDLNLTAGPAPIFTPPTNLPSQITTDIWNRIVGVITVLNTSDRSETIIDLTNPKFANSVFYGSQIVVTEYGKLAPKQFNIELLTNQREAFNLFDRHAEELVAAFNSRGYPFEVKQVKASYLPTSEDAKRQATERVKRKKAA